MADHEGFFARRTEAWTRRDAKALAATYADDGSINSPMFPHADGREAIERSFDKLFRVFPDWDITLDDPCISGNRAMQVCKVRATQRGEFMGIPGTGKRLEFDGVLIFDLRDGLIVRERRIYDFTGVLIQLGVLRGKPAL
ncbi:MAG TPA: ester cyclase [Vicinamibacterales bacterium]